MPVCYSPGLRMIRDGVQDPLGKRSGGGGGEAKGWSMRERDDKQTCSRK